MSEAADRARLPDLETAAEELAELLLPTLLEATGASAAKLQELARRLPASDAGVREFLEERGPGAGRELDACGARSREIGWCLGVLAAAAGHDVLHDRRESDGLAVLCRWVERAVAPRRLQPPAAEFPRMVPPAQRPPRGTAEETPSAPTLPDRGAGWELPFWVAIALTRAARAPSTPPAGEIRWHVGAERAMGEGSTLWVETSAAAAACDSLAELARIVPGGRALRAPGRIGIHLA